MARRRERSWCCVPLCTLSFGACLPTSCDAVPLTSVGQYCCCIVCMYHICNQRPGWAPGTLSITVYVTPLLASAWFGRFLILQLNSVGNVVVINLLQVCDIQPTNTKQY